MQLIEPELNAPSTKFINKLGLLGRAQQVRPDLSRRRADPDPRPHHHRGGASARRLYAHSSGPPYGLRARGRPRLRRRPVARQQDPHQSESGDAISATRDAGVRDVLSEGRSFKPRRSAVGDDPVGLRGRARICKFTEDRLGIRLDRENGAPSPIGSRSSSRVRWRGCATSSSGCACPATVRPRRRWSP
ncbi:MAG: hypothetical protein IPH44_43570 [Myxococcales bacterium]|nr:hypothetical protein [Myxococcales bacterium]